MNVLLILLSTPHVDARVPPHQPSTSQVIQFSLPDLNSQLVMVTTQGDAEFSSTSHEPTVHVRTSPFEQLDEHEMVPEAVVE